MFLCARCHRHVRETPCPFCGASEQGAPLAGPKAVRIGMKRSTVLAAAAVAAIGGGLGCGGNIEPSRPIPDAASDVVAPATDYGIPVSDDARAPTADAREEADAGTLADASSLDASSKDAHTEDVFAPGTDYGIPPGSP